MTKFRTLVSRVAGLFGRRRRDADLTDELNGHLQAHVDDGIRAGLTYGEARRLGRLKLGGVEMTKENYRDQRGVTCLDNLWRDVAYALRTLRRSPGFAVFALMTLAVGIGAATAVFTLVNAV